MTVLLVALVIVAIPFLVREMCPSSRHGSRDAYRRGVAPSASRQTHRAPYLHAGERSAWTRATHRTADDAPCGAAQAPDSRGCVGQLDFWRFPRAPAIWRRSESLRARSRQEETESYDHECHEQYGHGVPPFVLRHRRDARVKRAGGLLGGQRCRSGRQLVHGLRPIAFRVPREPNSVSWRGASPIAPAARYASTPCRGQSIVHIVAIDPVGIAASPAHPRASTAAP